MKALRLAITLTATTLSIVSGGDVEHGSSERFKVSYVETEELPPLTVISKELDDRKEALDEDERHVAEGLDAARLTMMRRATLQQMYFPIRVEDLKTGNIYEVQTDRRTILAKSKDGKILWKVNPYVDAKLTELKGPLKMHFHKYPYICYFGRTFTRVRSEAKDYTLQVTFTSKEFGGFDIRTGKFTLWGSD
jgi:hypothetical protein